MDKSFFVSKSKEVDWFDIVERLTDAVDHRLKHTGGSGDKKEYTYYKKTELGFCIMGTCVGASPSEAFKRMQEEKNPTFTINVRSIF